MQPVESNTKPYYLCSFQERVAHEFEVIIKKVGMEQAKNICFNIVRKQETGNRTLDAAKIFYSLFPYAANNETTFEFADNTTYTLTSPQLTALRASSKTIDDLLGDVESNTIPFSAITRTQFLAILNMLYPNEPFEKSNSNIEEIALVANYLDIREILKKISDNLYHQFSSFNEKDLVKALKINKTIDELPQDLRDQLQDLMSHYLGKTISDAPNKSWMQAYSFNYSMYNVRILTLNSNKCIPYLSKITTLRTVRLLHIKITDKEIELLPRNLTGLQLTYCRITDEMLHLLPQNLTYLNLTFSRITNEGLKLLPKTLTHLDLTRCDQITYEGVRILPPNLVLAGCDDKKSPPPQYLNRYWEYL